MSAMQEEQGETPPTPLTEEERILEYKRVAGELKKLAHEVDLLEAEIERLEYQYQQKRGEFGDMLSIKNQLGRDLLNALTP